MAWRGVAPVQLVIVTVGVVLWTSLLGIIILAFMGRPVPDDLGTLSIAAMTSLAALLAPNTGLVSTRASRQATAAGEAAAAAVIAQDTREESEALDDAVNLGNQGKASNGD